jgi:hypothetical protein
MKTPGFYLLSVVLLLLSVTVPGQRNASPEKILKEEQNKFLKQLRNVSIDSAIIDPLSRSLEAEIKGIHKYILTSGALTAAEKQKAVQSLIYFIAELNKSVVNQKLEVYDLPATFRSYRSILQAVMYNKPTDEFLKAAGPRRSQVFANAFKDYRQSPLFEDVATYKRVASSPEFILSFLENKPGYRFTDSLLYVAAVYNPVKFISFLNRPSNSLQQRIRNTENIYLQQIVFLSEEKNATELLPFVTQLAEEKITIDSILKTRLDVVKYFQLLVNTMKESGSHGDRSFVFGQLLRNGLREKSLYFYGNYINEQHNATDAVRFAPVKGLRPEDIYYIITSAGEELYTSSYLGLYKRLMEHFPDQSADSLFQIINYDNFRVFMRMAANYNVLPDFLSRMPHESAVALLTRFIAGIETETSTGLEKAMDIADSFTGLGNATDIIATIGNELEQNLARCKKEQQYFGIRLYSILLQVFDLVKQSDNLNKLWSTLGNYETLKQRSLQNKNGEIIELVLFYGDDDGVASFNNFQRLFTDLSKWEVTKTTSWITIRSKTDQPIVIYANLPLEEKDESDLRAQEALFAYMEQQGAAPSILVHRGHSYHLGKTLRKLAPSVKLAILGSCGSYNNAISIASINPDIQIIGSKKMGSKSINDPIISMINETLVSKNDLYWPEVWEKLRTRFNKDQAALNLFNEYIPPGKNVSLFVLKLFNYYNRAA